MNLEELRNNFLAHLGVTFTEEHYGDVPTLHITAPAKHFPAVSAWLDATAPCQLVHLDRLPSNI